jgi:hypothetical protein
MSVRPATFVIFFQDGLRVYLFRLLAFLLGMSCLGCVGRFGLLPQPKKRALPLHPHRQHQEQGQSFRGGKVLANLDFF